MKRNLIIFALFFLITGASFGYFLRSVIYSDTEIKQNIIKGNRNYPYISQRIDVESASETTQGQIVIMKNDLTSFIEEQVKSREVNKVAVYYRDLNNGPWLGINEKEGFSPASLLKVPIMMGIYKLADSDKTLLDRKVVNMVSSNGVIQDIVPSQQIQPGQSYTIDDLVRRMIIFSDNEAKNLLLTQIPDKDFDQIYKDLGMVVPGVISLEDYMSVRSYASFFRVLYNGSYLSKELSNKALALLSESEYKDGIVSGVPNGIPVSHKFGERGLEDGIKQLHDCGIIYNKENPYVLCVMTRGYDFKKLGEVIKEVSKIVYRDLQE